MKKTILLIWILPLLIFSTSCQKEKNMENQVKKENNIPKELIAVIESVDENESKILEIKTEVEKPSELEVKKDKEEMIKKIEEIKKPEENEKKVEEELKTVETYKETIMKMWNGLEKLVESNHSQANNYKVKAVEEKAEQKRIQKFEEDLNNLTIHVKNKDILNSFISNNEMYKDISYFTSLYKDYKSQIIMLKYHINNVYISGLKNEWDKALEGMNKVESQYSEVLKEFNKEVKEKEKKSEDDKKKEKGLEKLKLSIDSLKQSLNKQDVKLLEIKREIVVKDLEKVKE